MLPPVLPAPAPAPVPTAVSATPAAAVLLAATVVAVAAAAPCGPKVKRQVRLLALFLASSCHDSHLKA